MQAVTEEQEAILFLTFKFTILILSYFTQIQFLTLSIISYCFTTAELGDQCTTNEECKHIDNAECRGEPQQCHCLVIHPINDDDVCEAIGKKLKYRKINTQM